MTIVKSFFSIYSIYIDFRKAMKLLISYSPFWETLKRKKITTYILINKYNISSATIDRMKKGNGISTMKIDDFCRILNCKVSDIIEYYEDEN